MKGVIKALLSLTPVIAACYLLSSLRGNAALLLLLGACLSWCAWTVIHERRRLAIENFDGNFAVDMPSNVVQTVTQPPIEQRPSVPMSSAPQLSNIQMVSTRRTSPPRREAERRPASASTGSVRQFPMHKLSR